MTLTRTLTWLLFFVAIVEFVTLAGLIVNTTTIQNASFAPVVGPIHGIAYVLVIIGNLLLPRSARSRWLSLIPGIGGLLSNRSLRRTPQEGFGDVR